MKKIILIGAGGHCVSCIDVIENQRKFKIVGLIDNNKKNFLLNYRILGSDKELKKISKRISYALITTGHIKNSKIRERLFKKVLNCGFKFPTIISSLSYVSKHARIGKGTIVMHGSIVNSRAEIGENCIINNSLARFTGASNKQSILVLFPQSHKQVIGRVSQQRVIQDQMQQHNIIAFMAVQERRLVLEKQHHM